MKNLRSTTLLATTPIALACLVAAAPACAKDPAGKPPAAERPDADADLPHGRRLKDILAEKFPDGRFALGAATGLGEPTAPDRAILLREFAYATPENDFKQSRVAAKDPAKMDFSAVDAWIRYAKEHHLTLRAHGPISPQCSTWVKEDDRTPEELQRALKDFATAAFSHYDAAPEIKWMDVVNETVNANGTWFGSKPGTDKWENPWKNLGTDPESPHHAPLYVREAFEIATRLAPHKKLVYNQHLLTPKAWQEIHGVIKDLRKRDLRVDGFGWQAHVDVGWEKVPGNMELLAEAIDWCHARRMAFHVTEMNVFLKKDQPRTEADWQAQADTYRAIVGLLAKKAAGGEVTCNFWCLRDGPGESRLLAGKSGCLFDAKGRAKPAYYALQEMLEGLPTPKKN